MTKKCRGCHRTLPLEHFYLHPDAADGHLNRCKDCVSTRMRDYRASITPVPRPRLSTSYPRALKKWGRDYRNLIQRAQKTVARAVRDGLLTRPDTCSWCNKPGRIEAAHTDYAQPLNIIWLCSRCHHRWDYYQPKATLT